MIYLDFIFIIFDGIIKYFQNIFGLDYSTSKLFIIFIFFYLLFFVIFSFLHRKLIYFTQIKIRKINFEYDYVWYLIAKAMYEYNIYMQKQGKQNYLIHGVSSIFYVEKSNYIDNKDKIFEDIKKLEEYINQKVVSDEAIKKINKYQKIFLFWNSFQKFVGYFLTIYTCGLYRVYIKNL